MIEWNEEMNNLDLYQENISDSEWLGHGKILWKTWWKIEILSSYLYISNKNNI